jgi:hypothetical protein
MGRKIFTKDNVKGVEQYMSSNPKLSINELLMDK